MEEHRVFQINLTNFFKANPDKGVLPIALNNYLAEQLLDNFIPSVLKSAVAGKGLIPAFGKGEGSFEFEGMVFKCAFDCMSDPPIFRIEFLNARRNALNEIEAVRCIRNALLKVEKGVKLEALTKPSVNTTQDSRKNLKPPARGLRV